MSTCSGIGISLLAIAESKLDFPHPFWPIKPYLRPWFSSKLHSEISSCPLTCIENRSILTSSAVSRDANTPVTVRSTSSSSSSSDIVSLLSSFPSLAVPGDSSFLFSRSSRLRLDPPTFALPTPRRSSSELATLPWKTRHVSEHTSPTNAALCEMVRTPPPNFFSAKIKAFNVSLSR